MSTRGDIIKEALLNADKVKESTTNLVKEQLLDVFSNRIEESVNRAIKETVGVGKDQPSGYDQDEDQDALAFGSSKHSTAKKDDINKGGKGPQKLEGSINVDETYEEEEVDENDEFGGDFGGGEGEDDLDVLPIKDEELEEMYDEESDEELDEASEDEEEMDEAADDEEELDEKKEEEVDEAKEEEDVDEAKVLATEVAELKKENKEYKKALRILESKFIDINLLNAKLSGAMKFLRNPNLTYKQKETIVETFDRARNVKEVKLIVHTLNEASKLTTVRKPVVQKRTRSVASNRIDESYDAAFKRQQELAGIN